jgi:hypothetical protein
LLFAKFSLKIHENNKDFYENAKFFKFIFILLHSAFTLRSLENKFFVSFGNTSFFDQPYQGNPGQPEQGSRYRTSLQVT